MNEDFSIPLEEAYRRMFAHFGHQHWWPGESSFEICVGAILVQNTNWRNVERVIQSMKSQSVLDARKLFRLSQTELAALIRPAGYPNIKAKRLRAFLQVLLHNHGGQLADLLGGSLSMARERLLAIHGIGPETADSMLLYAGGQLTFVVDAYTRRIFQRHGWCADDISYHDLQAICTSNLENRSGSSAVDFWKDYHAQLVMVGKEFCAKKEPRCAKCPLGPLLPSNKTECSSCIH